MKPPEPASEASNEGAAFAFAGRGLPPGSRLGGFEVTGIIAEGEVAIVYAATDPVSNAEVAIAEYMPARLAERDREGNVTPRSPADTAAFTRGLEAFIVETRRLAHCNHPSLVRILGQWECNSTAYRVMPRYRGTLLLHEREALMEPPDESTVRALLDGLLGALEAFHTTGHSHGNVTPSSILVLDDGRPLLLGPNAAARAIADDGANASVAEAESGFAPIEQIVEPDVEPPYSADLYALAGVARYWMSGQLPAPALRGADAARPESVASITQRLAATWPHLHYGASLLDALDSTLSIYPAQRPQTVAQMRERLGAEPAAEEPPVEAELPTVVLPADAIAERPTPEEPSPSPSPEPRRRRIAMWVYGCFIVVALLGIGVHEFGQEYRLGRVLDVLGIGPLDKAADSTPNPAPAAPAPKPVPAPEARTSEPASPAPTPSTAVPEPPSSASAPATSEGASKETRSEAAVPAPPPPTLAPPTTTSPATTAPPAATPPPAKKPAPARSPPPPRAAQPRAAPEPASPRAACGERTEFSLYRCMQRQCSQRQWASHPQCERLRRTDRVD
jgi:non-specific serine/threonine protein kinase